ncbi:MAG TPA: metal ABC transporter substrate-binding protein [Thermodesulfovibrionales bacterium]|nr:metal ABC transporter substrate-binding protein [Thermodesulfovibrionales bacterium]
MKSHSLLTIFLLSLVFCAQSASAQPIKVVASIYPIGDMVKEVGGDRVEVRVLLPPGATPHVFEPTAKTAKELSEAAIFFEVGAGLEQWAGRLLKASPKKIKVVVLSEGMKLLHEEAGHGHKHEIGNPHVWLDPLLAIEMVRKIEKALIAADPAGSSLYRKQSADFVDRLHSLDAEIRETVLTFTIKNFVSFHSAWDYFALRYGLKSVGVIEESPGKEPSPRKLKAIVRTIKDHRIRAVFAEPQLNARAAQVIAQEAGVKVIILDPEGGLPGRETYLGLMRFNLARLKEAMQ